MENLIFSTNVVAPLFILMLTGYVARQIKFISSTFLSEANKFVFRFSLPLMLFKNIQSSFHGDYSNIKLIIYSMTGVLLVIFLSFCIVPLLIKKRGQRGSIIQGIYRSNFLIYGLPLATGMYGDAALAPISMLMGVIIPLYNIAAVIILSVYSENENSSFSLSNILKDIIKNPLIIGCVAGLTCGVLNLRFPVFIDIPLNEFANIATPLALFVMGGEFQFRSLRKNLLAVILTSFSRLIIVPLTAIIFFVWAGFQGMELSILLCLFGTPTAVSSYIMAKNMGCDGELAGQIVILTTIGSIVTIFLFIFILKTLGYL